MSFDPKLLAPIVRSAMSKEKEEKRRFVAIKSDTLPDEVAGFEVDGEPWEAHPVRSTLQARRVMAQAGEDGRRLLVTTILDDELGPEVMARLAQNQVHRIEPWMLVREAFQAQQIDPRVTREWWMASALLQHQPAGGYPRVKSGILDYETAWGALGRSLGFLGGEPSLEALVAACAEKGLQERWTTLSKELRDGMAVRLEERHGTGGGALVALLLSGSASDVVSIVLVAGAIAAAPESRERVVAEAMLNKAYGPEHPMATLADAVRPWCLDQIGMGSVGMLDAVYARSMKIAAEHQATSLLVHSALLPAGLEARLAELGDALRQLLAAPSDAAAHEVIEVHGRAALAHELIGRAPRFTSTREQVEAALRLTRWLGSEESAPKSLGEAAALYRDSGAWVDRLRYRLMRGTDASQWSLDLRVVASAARDRRERESALFAERLLRSTADQEGAGDIVPLERVYRDVVGPLAEELQVLVVVMDGMSQAVFQDLSRSVTGRTSLRRMVSGSARSWPAAVAPLPTVTEVARTSLMCGELTVGNASTEQRGQRALAESMGWIPKGSSAPLLFHKGALQQGGGGLSDEVLKAIDSESQVVTVVVNAVDDQLPKGSQLEVEWGLEHLRELEALVAAAEAMRRAVVLTADHGHVVELWESEGDMSHPTEKGERWRAPGRAVEEREFTFEGSRVLLPSPGGPAVLPWSERLRYCGRHAGYHGGASPQEVVVPLGVFVPANAVDSMLGAGWDDELVLEPWWWSSARAPEESTSRGEPAVPAPQPRRTKQPEPVGQARMFEERETVSAPAQAAEGASSDWLLELFESKIYKVQFSNARALRPNQKDIDRFLIELDRVGFAATFDGMRARLEMSLMRFKSLSQLVARILNIDGYAVLEVNQPQKTIRLDHGQLTQQFRLQSAR